MLKKFIVCQDVDYIVGHLRYGHKEVVVEVESREELEEKLKDKEYLDNIFEDSDLVIDDYEISDVGSRCRDAYIEKEVKDVKEDNYNYDYGILLLKELKGRLDNLQPSDTMNAVNKAIELFEERSKD